MSETIPTAPIEVTNDLKIEENNVTEVTDDDNNKQSSTPSDLATLQEMAALYQQKLDQLNKLKAMKMEQEREAMERLMELKEKQRQLSLLTKGNPMISNEDEAADKLQNLSIRQTELKNELDHDNVKSQLKSKLLELSQVQAQVNYLANAICFQEEKVAPKSAEEDLSGRLKTIFNQLSSKHSANLPFLLGILTLANELEDPKQWSQLYDNVKKSVFELAVDKKKVDQEPTQEEEEEEEESTLEEYLMMLFYMLESKGVKKIEPEIVAVIQSSFLHLYKQFDPELQVNEDLEKQVNDALEPFIGQELNKVNDGLVETLMSIVDTPDE